MYTHRTPANLPVEMRQAILEIANLTCAQTLANRIRKSTKFERPVDPPLFVLYYIGTIIIILFPYLTFVFPFLRKSTTPCGSDKKDRMSLAQSLFNFWVDPETFWLSQQSILFGSRFFLHEAIYPATSTTFIIWIPFYNNLNTIHFFHFKLIFVVSSQYLPAVN
jgi:hypothetical protein